MMALGVRGGRVVPHACRHTGEHDGARTRRYRFDDYWKLGLPLLLFFLAVAVVWVPFRLPF